MKPVPYICEEIESYIEPEPNQPNSVYGLCGISHSLAPSYQGRATALLDTYTNVNMYFCVYMDMSGHCPYMYTVYNI